MPNFRSWAAILVAALLVLRATLSPAAETLPAGVSIPKDLKLPLTVAVGAYVPSHTRQDRFYPPSVGYWIEPGKAIEDALGAVLKQYFTQGTLIAADNADPMGLLLVLHPKWQGEAGTIRLTFKYQVFGEKGAVILEGQQVFAAPVKAMNLTKSFYNAALGASQLAVADVVTKLRPDAGKYPAVNKLADLDPKLIVDRDHPVATGTGFFINATGQVMTAAHVLHDCAYTEVKRDDKALDSRPVASSLLLDLAVIDTGVPATRFLPLRKDAELFIGEPVANVGFPLQPILSASPNLTRGNVSSRGALSGSMGQFQFSAPIQPGSSGGPVVSDGGELLGVTVSTLNAASLLGQGALPQNVNFALDARFAALFLRRNHIAFTEVPANPKGDPRTGNEAALASVVRLSCFQ
ncbi:MAG TPA: serine protease [Steroidobacteraceae bacterium]|nr:serine protease [Steroidobacteraceae bacterium]